MIPKTIHYCWFSNEPLPKNVRKCIESWSRRFPDYTIKHWGADSFDFDSVPFTKEAISLKRWTFASDYVRLYALYTEGGIYLDSDVQAWESLDDWLQYDFFTGLEMRDKEHTDIYPEAAIMGSVKGNAIVKETLDRFDRRHLILEDGSLDLMPIPTVMKPILESKGWKPEDRTQLLDGNCVVFSTDFIANTNCERKSTVRLYHLNNRSWIPMSPLQKFLRFLKRIGVKKVYDFIKRIFHK